MSSMNRVTGMYSGLDTESLVNSLVSAKQIKVDNTKKDQMTVKYKQDAWTDLNKKVKNLFTSIGDLKYESAYSKYTTNVSDSSKASVITSDGAMLATQNLKITQLSKAGYMTGGKITATDTSAGDLTSASTLRDIGIEADTSIKINGNEIKLTADMTLGDVAKELSNYGVTAKFDASQQRMYISSKEAGKAGDFNITSDDADALAKLGLGSSAHKIDGQNAKIELNGVEYESNSNVFEINGLTITAKDVTGDDGITLDTTKDTSGIYDMIKKFVKQYSELINEMDKLYNTKADKGYKPLTDEEKSALSDYEVEKWDKQLKDQALSKDSTIYSLTQALEGVFNAKYTIGDKDYYLSDFGIETASYFSADENEKHALHIYGDEDDSLYSAETNKLLNAITTDPDKVAKMFSQVFQNLYKTMSDMSTREANYRTFGNFYDDIKMKSDYTSYNSKISDMEAKLSAYEDKWYKKFSTMETTLAKLQSNQNAVSGLFGM